MENHTLLAFSDPAICKDYLSNNWIIADECFPTRKVFRYKMGGTIRCAITDTLENAWVLGGHEFTCVVIMDDGVPDEVREYLKGLIRGIPE